MKLLTALVFALLFYLGCKKEDQRQLPEITSTGARTFGCKVNGGIFKTSGVQSNNWNKAGVKFNSYADKSIEIDASQDSPHENIYMRFKFNDTPGTYYLNDKMRYIGIYHGLAGGSTAIDRNNEYKTNDINTGVVHVAHFDGNIISGTFSFDAVNENGVIVHITEGRFDIPR
jgi:hypothetical protein